ncbi:LCP family protein [Streptomyces sp. WMMB 322]|uniref:LCP family protein n=1 Tax=Streptomyces sp. WMMB 322 TaxID=1286821 RepID=UPI0008237AEC|nr:LCP family protein [Streptomyces sp. WMMB 322]SCK11168.1 transcriptional attenuator, LytR family [Streptomyces sp. WMMB 322]
MNDWPGGWNDSHDRYGAPRAHRGVPQQSRGGYDAGYGGHPGYDGPGAGYDSGYSTGQVYGGGNRGGYDGYDAYPYDDAPPRRRGPRFKSVVISLVVILLTWAVGTYFWADSKLRREVDLSIVQDRPVAGEGTNYLIVGSDSREGLSAQQRKELRTGSAAGKRTDSMMILHVGSGGPTLISLPRDSYVEIPPFKGSESGKQFNNTQRTKLNAAYSQDGAPLLVRTVEHNTGLKIDHYAEIGFGGFAQIVDAVGGVEMNIPQDIKDKDSGADFRKGKQTLDGKQALSFVRNRHAGTGDSDLGRTKNQQKFLAALANQTATPSTVLNPFRLYPTLGAGLDTLVVDEEMSLWNLGSMFFAMKDVNGGEGKRMNMPIAGSAPGGSLQWDKPKVQQLVQQLKNDEKVTVTSDR